MPMRRLAVESRENERAEFSSLRFCFASSSIFQPNVTNRVLLHLRSFASRDDSGVEFYIGVHAKMLLKVHLELLLRD